MPKRVTKEDIEAFAAEMQNVNWNDPEQRRAIALTILEFVQEDVMKEDLESLLTDVYSFNVGESPQWLTRQGLKAYVHEPGSYAPRSTITQKALTINTEQVSVHPEFELNQLRAGRYGSIADVRTMAVEELLGRKYSIIWATVIGSITAAASNYATVSGSGTASTKLTALDVAIDHVEDESPGGVKAIVGRYTALGWITTTSLWSNQNKAKIEDTGNMGNYRGIPIVKLHQYTDGYGNKWITDDEILVIGQGSTKLGRNQGLEVMDDLDINTKMWDLRIDEQYGVAVHYPNRNYRIHLS